MIELLIGTNGDKMNEVELKKENIRYCQYNHI